MQILLEPLVVSENSSPSITIFYIVQTLKERLKTFQLPLAASKGFFALIFMWFMLLQEKMIRQFLGIETILVFPLLSERKG